MHRLSGYLSRMWRTGLQSLWSHAEWPMRYLHLKQLRKFVSEVRKKKKIAWFQDWWLEKANMQLIPPPPFPFDDRNGVSVWLCEAETLPRNKGYVAPLRTQITRNVLPPIHCKCFSSQKQHWVNTVAEYYSEVQTVCWQNSNQMVRSEVEPCMSFTSGTLLTVACVMNLLECILSYSLIYTWAIQRKYLHLYMCVYIMSSVF